MIRRDDPDSIDSNMEPDSSETGPQNAKLQNEALQSPSPSHKTSKWYETSVSLGTGYIPIPLDVICARGKKAWNHPGNTFFRALADQSAEQYGKATSRFERSVIVTQIIETIRSKGGKFVKKTGPGKWIEVGDLLAREKCGQMLRNALSGRYRSSVAAKKHRKRGLTSKLSDSLQDLLRSHVDISRQMTQMEDLVHASSDTSDEKILDQFTAHQVQLLHIIKQDQKLVEAFQAAEVAAEVANNIQQAMNTIT